MNVQDADTGGAAWRDDDELDALLITARMLGLETLSGVLDLDRGSAAISQSQAPRSPPHTSRNGDKA
jgi:hypothetical protein